MLWCLWWLLENIAIPLEIRDCNYHFVVGFFQNNSVAGLYSQLTWDVCHPKHHGKLSTVSPLPENSG